MPTLYIDSILNFSGAFKNELAATHQFRLHKNKRYQYIGQAEIQRSTTWKAQRWIAITALAIAILCTLGLLLLSNKFKDTGKNLWKQLHAKEIGECYALHTLENWCLLKQTDSITEPPSTLKSFLDSHLQKQLSDGDVDSSSLQRIHDRLIQERNIPAMLGQTPLVASALLLPGLSLLALYLANKTGQQDLFVCRNLAALRKELIKIKSQTSDCRKVFIAPTYASVTDPSKTSDCEQHKVAICIEKKAGKIKICIMNSGMSAIDATKVHLQEGNFSEEELVFSYLDAANLPADTLYYVPRICRQARSNDGGCSTFALRDAIGFLDEPNFFQNVQPFSGTGSVKDPIVMGELEPNFMKTSQFLKDLTKYIAAYPGEAQKPLGRAGRTLTESLTRHSRVVGSKTQNRLISDRVLKYKLLLLFLMRHMTDDQINTHIKTRLISS